MRRVLLTAALTVLLSSLTAGTAAALGGEGETWPAFTESSGCGAQRIPTPHADDKGWFARDELLRGDFAAMFGRTVGQVHQDLVRWPIPGSAEVLAVHPWMVPALDAAAVGLISGLASDLAYRVDPKTTYSAASRTIGGSLRTSRHTYGTAFDINAPKNPHRSDNRLITDIPSWWRQSFLDAGFCWGGLWIGSKDTMHFAWQGPAFSDYASIPLPYEPLTDREPFRLVRSFTVVPQEPSGTLATTLTDIDNNGARDIVRIARLGLDLLIESSAASWQHNACSVRTSVVTGLGGVADTAAAIGFGDWDGEGGQDLWIVSDINGSLKLTVRAAFGNFARETTAVTTVPTPAAGSWISTGDVDVDGSLDLFIGEGSTLRIWGVDPVSGDSELKHESRLPFDDISSGVTFTLGDVDLDNRPDLWAVGNGVVQVALASDGYERVFETQWPHALPSGIVDAATADYDGDGRVDLMTFDGVRKLVWLGNSELPDGLTPEVWFAAEDPECDDARAFGGGRSELIFTSSRWLAQGAYEWRSKFDLPSGCNPDDEQCDPGLVTHATFAEFLAWVDGLSAAGEPDFRSAPRALARAGYDVSCPIEDEGCWEDPMLASEVASRFGMFLAERSGFAGVGARWVLPTPERSSLLSPRR